MFESYLKARYPVLYIVSPEEARIEYELATTVSENKWRLIAWSHTDGFINIKGQAIEQVEDPIEALSKIRQAQGTLGGIDLEKGNIAFLFRDLSPFFTSPKVVRLVRDIAREFKTQGKTLVITASYNQLPIELQRDVTLLEFELPDRKMIGVLLDKFLEDNKKTFGDVDRDERAAIIEACMGLTTTEAENAVAKAVVDWRKLQKDNPKGDLPNISVLVMEEKAKAIKKTGILEYYPVSDTMKDVGGLANFKEWMSMRQKAFSEKARDFGLPSPRGVLFVGLPGTGKSLAAKACAKAFGVPLIRFDIGRVFSGLVGSSEANMRIAIQTAEAIGMCVLWLDEIEKAFAGLASSGTTDSGVSARVFGSFITWMQEKKVPVFVVATCNKISGLPPELTRKGRFDDIFFVDAPDPKEREEILKIHIQKRGRDPKKFDLADCVSNSEGFSGAELEEAVVSGLFNAFYKGQEITDFHIQHAILNTVPLSRSRASDMAEMRDWAGKFAQHASKKKEVVAKDKRELAL